MSIAENSVEFGELPPDGRGPQAGKWKAVGDVLRARPGEWAKVSTRGSKTAAHNAARHIRLGHSAMGAEGEFEATGRGLDVWARYVGGAE